MRPLLLALACTLLACRPGSEPDASPGDDGAAREEAATEPQVSPAYRVVPGEQFARVTAETSRRDLLAAYGDNKVEDIEVPVGEGFTEPGARVTLSPEATFDVIWASADKRGVKSITTRSQAFRTPEGLGVGSTLEELEAVLGPFQVAGFGWDYGGTVFLEDTHKAAWKGELLLRLAPADEASQAEHASNQHFQQVQGDERFASSNEHLRALKPTVHEMVVTF